MTNTIVISEFMDEPAVERLRQIAQVDYRPELVDNQEALLQSLANATALIVRNRTQVNAQLLAHAPRLQVVGRLGVGLDNIDMDLCADKGITVYPAVGANAQAVAEYVIATTFVLLRGAYLASAQVTAGKWPRPQLSNGLEVAGRTLGLVGFGGIGQLTARLASALGMKIAAYDPMINSDSPIWAGTGAMQMSLDELLQHSDVVSLHTPLTKETRHLINASRIARMKAQAVLINTSRGGIVDEQALVAALQAGKLLGAALDVFEDEPVKAKNSLPDMPNLILTPHIAGLTQEANERVSGVIAEKVMGYLEGK
ncbi:D-3-phosphoglycerate dehydrogenase [Advenella kashmirensis WT001]|uniref:D-3-phosphoglycerate dehydrogenase n=1 Tax=Advenella kashmirensis (strain DSM 17095 / LMG 22695 / WT001) TaxID=1036672 RepID=I3UGX0_ADVKW|nr:hydroxyacid dehydrogenase [Advenella kashmirensis]AFK64258.1 D-3-phosphoglycerate dehydrogenase [Advenella kashmirensis WT001]